MGETKEFVDWIEQKKASLPELKNLTSYTKENRLNFQELDQAVSNYVPESKQL